MYGTGMLLPTPLSARIFSWFCAVVTSNEAEMLPVKMGLLSLRVYYVSVSSCKDCYPPLLARIS